MADQSAAQEARGKAARVVDDAHLVEAKVERYFPQGSHVTDAQNAAISGFKSWTFWDLASWWATVSATPDFLLNAAQTSDEADTKRRQLDTFVAAMTAAGVFSGQVVTTDPNANHPDRPYHADLYDRAKNLNDAVTEIVPQLDPAVATELVQFNDKLQADISEGQISEADAEAGLAALGSMIARAGLPGGQGGSGCGAAAVAILLFGANSV